jgi:hypothetical protein
MPLNTSLFSSYCSVNYYCSAVTLCKVFSSWTLYLSSVGCHICSAALCNVLIVFSAMWLITVLQLHCVTCYCVTVTLCNVLLCYSYTV